MTSNIDSLILYYIKIYIMDMRHYTTNSINKISKLIKPKRQPDVNSSNHPNDVIEVPDFKTRYLLRNSFPDPSSNAIMNRDNHIFRLVPNLGGFEEKNFSLKVEGDLWRHHL